jgi:hypothetical protein
MCQIQARVATEAQLRVSRETYFLMPEGIGSIGGSEADLLELKGAA